MKKDTIIKKNKSQEVINGIKQRYTGLTIGQIEKDLQGKFYALYVNHREFILGLMYLRDTTRFKENPMYKNSTFELYVNDRFGLAKEKYHNMLIAYINFPDESMKWGAELIGHIKKKCGIDKIATVVDKITAKDATLKGGIKREGIERIILDESKDSAPKKELAPPADYKVSYEEALRTIRQLQKEKYALSEQIKKLKKTVRELQPYKKIKNAIEPFIIQGPGSGNNPTSELRRE